MSNEPALRAMLGDRTFERGRAYERQGAVRSVEWETDGATVRGEVDGTASASYRVEVTVIRSPTGSLRSLAAHCSCPVGFGCKHAVALLLARPAGFTSTLVV